MFEFFEFESFELRGFLKIDVYIDTDLNTSVYNGYLGIKKFRSSNLYEIGQNIIEILNNLDIKPLIPFVYINGINGHVVREYVNRRGYQSTSTELIT